MSQDILTSPLHRLIDPFEPAEKAFRSKLSELETLMQGVEEEQDVLMSLQERAE